MPQNHAAFDPPATDDGPPPKWSWGARPPQTYCLAFAVILMPPVMLFASTQMAALLLLAGGLMLITNPVSGLGPLRMQRYLIPVLLILALGALSGLWAVEGAETAKRFWRLVGFTAFGVLVLTHARELPDRDRTLIGSVLVAAFWVLFVFFAFERFSGAAITALVTDSSEAERYAILNRPGTMLLLLSWPAAGFLFVRKKIVHAVLLLLAAGLVQVGGQGQTVILAWLAGGVAAAAGAVAPRVWAAVLGALIAFCALLSPFALTQPQLQAAVAERLPVHATSLRHRLLIWKFSAEMIAERPFLGWGLAGSRAVPGADQPALAYAQNKGVDWVNRSDSGIFSRTPVLPLHPHNAFVQIWLELGLLGAVLAAGFFWLCAQACRAGPPGVRACRFGLMASAVTIACFSYGVWQSWWIAALFLVASLCAAIPDKVRRD